VRAGLAAVPGVADVVLIHDGARPLVTVAIVDRALRAAASGTGAIAAVPVTDTLKVIDDDGAITATVDRRDLWRAQTPQAFPREMIVDAYRRAAEEGVAATDDAALVERYGGRVVVVEGDARNLKITRPEDLGLAELLLRTNAGAET
ncbi:MAG: IspD/TarI family cytidylyltransferase, partial [Gemmatimonadota bacterium]